MVPSSQKPLTGHKGIHAKITIQGRDSLEILVDKAYVSSNSSKELRSNDDANE